MQKIPQKGGSKGRGASKLRRGEGGQGSGLLTLGLVVLSLVLFTASVREGEVGPVHAVRNVAQTIVWPVRMLGSAVASPFSGLSNVMRNLTADEKTLLELQEENRRLAARNVELEEAELTAKRLQALLDIQSTYNLQSVAASVIAGAEDSWSATITIDKGATSGITVGMPVVNSMGAVGQVIACGATTSTVRLLTDENSSISAMVQSSRAQGMLEGSVDSTLHLAYIRTDQTISVGDIVVTSGLGGVFPKGLPMGKVSLVESTPGSAYYDIVVDPLANPGLVEEVMVVTSLTEGQEATAEDIAVADAADLAAAGRTSEAATQEDPESAEDVGTEDADESDAGATSVGLSVRTLEVEQDTEEVGATDADQ